MRTGWIFAAGALALAAPNLALAQEGQGNVVKTSKMLVRGLVQQISDETGVLVLADSTVSTQETMPLTEPTTAATLEATLDALVKKLPRGTVWAKVYLPVPEPGRRYTGDAVVAMVQAQKGLVGRKPDAQPNTVEILGRQYPEADAQAAIRALNLAPVYVLTNPTAPGRAGLARTSGPGGVNGNDMMNSLMKQLGVTSARDIPSGTYKVPITLPDGSTAAARVNVQNDGNGTRVSVEVGGPPPGGPSRL